MTRPRTQVSPEQLVQPNELGWGSLRGALVHILDAEYGWFDFLFGEDDAPDDVQPENFASVAALRTRWNTENENLWRCLNRLAPTTDLTRVHTRERGSRGATILSYGKRWFTSSITARNTAPSAPPF